MIKVQVIEDPYDILPQVIKLMPVATPDVTVRDDKSFIFAAREIERVKQRTISSLTIHVPVTRYFRLLSPITWGDGVIETTSLDPVTVVEQITGLQVHRKRYSGEDLLNLDLLGSDTRSVAEKVAGYGDDSIDPILLLVLLRATGDIEIISKNTSPAVRLARLAVRLNCMLQQDSKHQVVRTAVSYARELAKACNCSIARVLAEYIEACVESCQADALSESLMIHYLLRNYPKLGRDKICSIVVGCDRFTITDIDGYGNLMRSAYDDLTILMPASLLQRIDNALMNVFPDVMESVAGHLPALDRMQMMIPKSSGLMEAEYRLLVELMCQELDNNDIDHQRVLLSRLANWFRPLLERNEKLRHHTFLLEKVLCCRALMSEGMPNRSSPFSQWSRFYREVQLYLDDVSVAIREANDCSLVPSALLETLRDEIAQARVDSNAEYAHWLMTNFPDVLKHTYKHFPRSVMTVPAIVGRLTIGPQRVILWVVDAMCWDHWDVLHELLVNKGLCLKEPVSELLSMIPSSTLISRRALFGGKTLAALLTQHQQSGVSPHNEGLSLGRALGLDTTKAKTEYLDPESLVDEGHGRSITRIGNDLAYVLGGPGEFRQVLGTKPKVTALVTSDVDGLWHSVMASTSAVKKSVRHILEEIVDAIAPHVSEGVHLVVATDHGTVSAHWSSAIGLPQEITTTYAPDQVEVHPRYAVITADTRMQHNLSPHDGWHHIARASLRDYGLPPTHKAKGAIIGVEMYALPGRLEYLGSSGIYMHGGTSYYETITPCAVLVRDSDTAVPPEVTVTGDVKAKQASRLCVRVFNRGTYMLKDIVLTMPELDVFSVRLGNIDRSGHRGMNLKITAEDVGPMQASVHILYSTSGRICEVTHSVSVDVKPSISSSVSRVALRKER